MTQPPIDPAAPARTRKKRAGVILRALIDIDGATVERRVRNLSEHGACVDNEGDLVAGKQLVVTMGQLERLSAEVVWAEDKLAGLSFRRALDLEAARKPRGTVVARGGWVGEMSNPYRKRA